MGKEFVVNSLEDMCALMCDNNTERLEERKMADIELVIKIPEEYRKLFETERCKSKFDALATNEFGYVLRKAFEHGTPLPKGHGRLIDADALIKSTDKEEVHMYEIALAPTIIEADKAESEEM